VADQVPRDVVAGLLDLGDDVVFTVVVARLLWRALPPFHVAEAVELRQQLEAELLEVGRVEVLEAHPVRAASVGLSAAVGRVRHVAAKGRSEADRASSVAVVSVLR
jgi:hypothetical protein